MENLTSGQLNNCSMSALYWKACEVMFQATYYALTPFYVTLGILGHSVCFMACYRKAKQEKAYFYQVFVACSELLQVVTGGLCYVSTAFYGIIGAERRGRLESAFQSNYYAVWYYACVASPLVNSFITSSLLLSVCTTVDRVFALAKPFAYKASNRKRWQIACFAVCLFSGLGTSAFDVPRKNLHPTVDGRYAIGFNTQYTTTIYFTFLSQLRNAVRIAGLSALVVSNSIMIYLYRRRIAKVCNMVGRNEAKEAEKKNGEKTLLIVTAFQSVSNFFSMSCLLLYYFLFSFLPGFSTCGIFLMWPVMDFAVGFTYGFDFYFGLIISKQFRNFVSEQLAGIFSISQLTVRI